MDNDTSALLMELDKLKSVYRKSYVSSESRNENSAEHSWHLAVAIMVMKPLMPEELDTDKVIHMALLHDICEIGAGDVCAFYAGDDRHQRELTYMDSLSRTFPEFGSVAKGYWQEYEAQETPESEWVKVVDKLLPFLLNLASKGRTWREQGITKNMVLSHYCFMTKISPTIHSWIINEIEQAARNKWLPVD